MTSGFFDDAIQTLHDLGLTIVQAKVYLTLAKSESLTIAGIADLSKVPRTDLYRVIKELEEEGMVERILAHPVQFKSIPIAECFLLLLQRRTEKTNQYRSRAIKLLQDNRSQSSYISNETKDNRFILVPSSRVVDRIAKAIDSAQREIDLILSGSRFSRGAFIYLENMKKALARGVKCRIVFEKGEKDSISPQQLQFLKSRNCQMKFINRFPQTVLGIYDNQEVFIIENPAAELAASPALWSNNASLIALAKDFFETLWPTAGEITI